MTIQGVINQMTIEAAIYYGGYLNDPKANACCKEMSSTLIKLRDDLKLAVKEMKSKAKRGLK